MQLIYNHCCKHQNQALDHKYSPRILIVSFLQLLVPDTLGKCVVGYRLMTGQVKRQPFICMSCIRRCWCFLIFKRKKTSTEQTLAFKLDFVVSCYCSHDTQKSPCVLFFFFVINLLFCPAIAVIKFGRLRGVNYIRRIQRIQAQEIKACLLLFFFFCLVYCSKIRAPDLVCLLIAVVGRSSVAFLLDATCLTLKVLYCQRSALSLQIYSEFHIGVV